MGGDIGLLSCPPSQSVTFNILIHLPSDFGPDSYQLNFNLVSEFNIWIKDYNDGTGYGNYYVAINVV